MTLYDYTKICLQENGKTFDDIIWIGNKKFQIEIEDFIRLSQQLEMDPVPLVNRIYLKSIPEDILIVGEDFWLERPVYYDAMFENLTDLWIFNTMPKRPVFYRKIKTLSAEYLPEGKEWTPFEVKLNDLLE